MKLTPTQKLVLSFIASKPRFPAQYAAKVDKPVAAVARVLTSLEKSGLVKGELLLASQNFAAGTARYARAYSITPEGAAIVAELDVEL